MKKIITVFAMLTLLLSCSSGPESAVKNFTENLAKGKIDQAKKYATEPTGKILDLASSFGGLPVNPDFKFEMVKDSIIDNRAWVTFTNQDEEEKTMELVKIDGVWLVHLENKK